MGRCVATSDFNRLEGPNYLVMTPFDFVKGPIKISASYVTKIMLKRAQGKENLRAACPKGKLEFKFLGEALCNLLY